MRLALLHPHVAFRDCAVCQEWEHYEEGSTAGVPGEIQMWQGQPLKRIGPPPCRLAIKCPKGTPETPKTLNDRNLLAYLHYLECKAVNDFPSADPIVRRNAQIISAAIDDVERARRKADVNSLARAFLQ